MRKQILKKVLLPLLGLVFLGLFVVNMGIAHAANPSTISFQGKIVNASDGTNITTPTGTYSIVFRIYNTSSPTMTTSCTSTASCLWQETQASVQLTNGVFQVELGASCALTSSSCNNSTGGPINFSSTSSLYLTMQFNGDTSGSNGGFMSPLIHMNSVPFALQADNSATLAGLSASNFVQLAQGLQTDSSTSNASIAINKTNVSGTPDILLLQKSGKNVLEVNNSGTVLIGQAGASGLDGTLTFNNSAGTHTVSLSLQADPGSSYNLLLPTTGPSTSQCLQTDATTANQLKFASCGGGGTTLSSAYTAGSAGDQVISLTSTNDSLIIRDPAGSGSDSGTSPLYIDELATGTKTGLTVALAADSSIGSNTRTGIAITSGNITQGSAVTGTYVGANITMPNLFTTTSATALDGYGLKISTGNLTVSSGSANPTATGLYIDNSTTTISGTSLLKGINVNVGAVSSTGVYTAFNISTNGSSRTLDNSNGFLNNAAVGINLDLGTNVTVLGSLTAQKIILPAESTLSGATRIGLSLTSGSITENTSSSLGLVIGEDITIPALTTNFNGSTAIGGYGLRVKTGNITQTTGTLTENALFVDTSSGTLTSGTINGLKIGSVSDPGSGVTSTAINISSGWDKAVMIASASATAFVVQNGSSQNVVVVDASGGKLLLGNAGVGVNGGLVFNNSTNSNTFTLSAGVTGGNISFTLPTAVPGANNYCMVSSTGGALSFLACGAGSTASTALVPEFAGAVMTADGGSNTGTMTSDFCGNDGASSFPDLNTGVCNTSGDFHNYYNWTSTGANDYEVIVRWRVPSDFSTFSTVQFNSKKSASGDDVKLTIYTNAGAVCGTGTSMTNTASAWQTTTYTISGCSPSAGDTLVFDIHMAVAANGNTVQMGEIPITYNRN